MHRKAHPEPSTVDAGHTPDEAADRARVRRLQSLFESEPELIVAMLETGTGEAQPDIRTVLRAAREAAATHPSYPDLHYFAARAAFQAGETAEADRLAGRALELNPDYLDALILQARVARNLAAPRRAIAMLHRAVDAGGEYADVYLMLSDLLRDQGETKTAEHAYENALRLNGNLARGRRALERGTPNESEGEGT